MFIVEITPRLFQFELYNAFTLLIMLFTIAKFPNFITQVNTEKSHW